jgi:hypothetical protein
MNLMSRFRKHIPVVAVIAVIIASLTLASCRDFFGTEDLKESIREEVVVATAEEGEITVRSANTNMGFTSPLGPTTVKVGVPFVVTASPYSQYAFLEWQQEGGEPGDIEFDASTDQVTSATVVNYSHDLAIVAEFDARPYVLSTNPFNNETRVAITRPIRISFSEPVDPATVNYEAILVQRRLNGSLSDPENINDHFEDPPTISSSGSEVTLSLANGKFLGDEFGTYEIFVTVFAAIADLDGHTMASTNPPVRFVTDTEGDSTPPNIGPITVKRTSTGGTIDLLPAIGAHPTNTPAITLDFEAADPEGSPVTAVITDQLEHELYNEIHTRNIAIDLEMGEGPQTLTIVLSDSSGNSTDEPDATPATVEIFYDLTAPDQPQIGPGETSPYSDGSTYYYQTTGVDLDLSSDDTGTLVAGFSTSSSGTDPQDPLIVTTSGSVYAVDNAGNVSTGLPVSVVQDNSAPVISNVSVTQPGGSWARVGTVFSIAFQASDGSGSGLAADPTVAITSGGDPVTGTVSVGGVAPNFTATYTMQTGDSEGAIGFVITAVDHLTNSAPYSVADSGVQFDKTAPTIAVSAPSAARVKDGTDVTYTVTYGGANSVSLGSGDISITGTGTASVVDVTGTGNTTRTVRVRAGSTDGPVGISIASGTASDAAGNTAPSASSSTSFQVDNTPPSAPGTPTKTSGSAGYINASESNVSITVNFSTTGALQNDVLYLAEDTLGTLATRTLSSADISSGSHTFSVSTSAFGGDGSKSVTAYLVDEAGNQGPASGALPLTKDTVKPGEPSAPTKATDYINASETNISISVDFSTAGALEDDRLYLVEASEGTLATRTLTSADISSGSYEFIVARTLFGDDGPKSVTAYLVDAAGNPGDPSDALNLSKDTVPPTISVSVPSSTSVKDGDSVTYTVTYGGASSITLVKGDVSTTGLGGATVDSVTGGGTTRTVTLTAGLAEGAVGISIVAGTAEDAAGNSAASASSSISFQVDNTPPSISFSSPSQSYAKDGDTVTFTVTYGGASSITLVKDDVSTTGAGGATVDSVTGGGATRTVTLTAGSGDGEVGISIVADTAVDEAGNSALSASSASTFLVDNTAPELDDATLSATASDVTGFSITETGSGVASYSSDIGGSSFNGATLTTSVVLNEGEHQDYVLGVTDNAGNTGNRTVRHSLSSGIYSAAYID